MTITEFLLERIAADEAFARDEVDDYYHGACAERTLLECEAKRAIVSRHARDDDWDPAPGRFCFADREDFPCLTLRHLAAVYADHSDYDQTWAP